MTLIVLYKVIPDYVIFKNVIARKPRRGDEAIREVSS
jgi:hypothetical protein